MALSVNQLTLPLSSRYSKSPSLHLQHLNLRPQRHSFWTPTCVKSSASGSPAITHTPLYHLKPYLEFQWQPILSGWLCSAISVYSLSQIVPKVGEFSAVMTRANAMSLEKEALVLGALVLVRIIAGYLQQAFLWEAALNCEYEIRVFVYRRVLQRDIGFFEGKDGVSAGDIAYRITAEASDVADTVYCMLNMIVPNMLQLLAMASQMLVISPVLSLISALVIPVMALMVGYLGENLRQISNKAHVSSASLSAYLNEVLPAILFVKANNAELCENVRFQSRASTDLSACLEKKKLKALIPQMVQMLYTVLLSTFCAVSLVLSRGSFDSSAMVSFVTSLYLLIEPVQAAGKAYHELKQGEPAVERLFAMTKFTSQVSEMPNSIGLDKVSGQVRFCGVSFKYGDRTHLVLNGLDLHIKAGETVALVGPSGGGKTTLAKLLLRLYDPLCGSILIDGHDIQSIQLDKLRRHVGLVSQDTMLFSGTIAENIGYRDLMAEIDMERVELAARTANADQFIQTLPDRYQTDIGPRGSILSGGQRQTLAIARAIYQNPSILILDEATSALDSKSEQLVRQALQRLMQNRTVLVIAHRLETILMAERILLLDGGTLQELSRSSLLDAQHTSPETMALVI